MNCEASFKHVSLKFLSVLILRAIVYNDACVRVSLSLSLSLSFSLSLFLRSLLLSRAFVSVNLLEHVLQPL
jgi:hypothetical protein